MNPALYLAAFDGALVLVEKLSPIIAQMFNNGEITIEQQAALKARIAALSADDAFSGPEWKVTNEQ